MTKDRPNNILLLYSDSFILHYYHVKIYTCVDVRRIPKPNILLLSSVISESRGDRGDITCHGQHTRHRPQNHQLYIKHCPPSVMQDGKGGSETGFKEKIDLKIKSVALQCKKKIVKNVSEMVR